MKKYPFLYEIPIFYSILFGINFFLLPHLPGFVAVEPHPYWIGILLFGFRYGVAAGLLSGVVSAVLYFTSAWFYLERYLFEDLSFYILPSLFVIVGVLIGVGVERYQAGLAKLKEEKDLLAKNEALLKEELKTVKEINNELEKKIVTRMSTLITLYEGARRLESIDLDYLYKTVVEFVAKTLEADEIALYLKNENQWQVRESFGWKVYKKWPKTLALNEGLTGLASTKGKIITIRDLLGDKMLEKEIPSLTGDAVMAGPVRKGENGEVLGVLSVQNIGFLHFNSATVTLFSFLLNWVSRSIGHAYYVQELKANEILDPVYQIYSHQYFGSRGEQEFLRSKTYYLPLGLGLVGVEGSEILLKTVCQLIKKCSRDMDVIAMFPESSIPFVILWITASPAQALAMKEKILENFAILNLNISLNIGISNFSPQTKSFQDMVAVAKEDLQGVTSRARSKMG